MWLDSGKLNKRISFLSKEEVENENGQTVLQDVIYKTVWAKITPIRGYEQTIEERTTPRTVYNIVTRYHKGIKQDMKIEYNGEKLDIVQICNVEEGNYALEIQATLRGELQ